MKYLIGSVVVWLACFVHTLEAYEGIGNRWISITPKTTTSLMVTFRGQQKFRVREQFAKVDSYHVTIAKDPIWGPGKCLTATFPDGSLAKYQVYEDSPFVFKSTVTANPGSKRLVVASQEVLVSQISYDGSQDDLRTFGSGFLGTLDSPTTSFSFMSVVEPATRNGIVCGQLTHEQASGVFTCNGADNGCSLTVRLDYGRFQVEASDKRETETLVLGYFADVRLGLEAYADAVARQCSIKLKQQAVDYCTWYHARASDEKRLADNTAFAEQHLAAFGLDVIQIDDDWQRLTPTSFPPETKKRGKGPVKTFVEPNENFPSGMDATAKTIQRHNMTAGIWFMPFAGGYRTSYFADKQDLFARWGDGTPVEDPRWSGTLLDMTNPKTRQFVHARTKRIYDWGYRYFKMDGMHTGTVTYNVYVNTGWRDDGLKNSRNFVGQQTSPGKVDSDKPSDVLFDKSKTHIEAYRIGLDTVRAAAPDAFLLGCNVSQNMRSMGAAFGKIDAMRIGPDNGRGGSGRWDHVTKGALHGSNLYFLNARVWHNDPDPVYVRASNPLNSARWMVSWVAVTGSMLTMSEQFADLPSERLDLLKRAMPSVFRDERCGGKLVSRPVDLFDSSQPKIWLLTDRREARRDIVGLFNWNEKDDDQIECSMERLGLKPDQEYLCFDYWANRFVGPIKGRLVERVPGGSCRILALRANDSHPVVVSTSRHITQGVVDLDAESWDTSEKKLSGRSQLVGGDSYELRIAWGEADSWKPREFKVSEGVSFKLHEVADTHVRVTLDTKTNVTAEWELKFQSN